MNAGIVANADTTVEFQCSYDDASMEKSMAILVVGDCPELCNVTGWGREEVREQFFQLLIDEMSDFVRELDFQRVTLVEDNPKSQEAVNALVSIAESVESEDVSMVETCTYYEMTSATALVEIGGYSLWKIVESLESYQLPYADIQRVIANVLTRHHQLQSASASPNRSLVDATPQQITDEELAQPYDHSLVKNPSLVSRKRFFNLVEKARESETQNAVRSNGRVWKAVQQSLELYDTIVHEQVDFNYLGQETSEPVIMLCGRPIYPKYSISSSVLLNNHVPRSNYGYQNCTAKYVAHMLHQLPRPEIAPLAHLAGVPVKELCFRNAFLLVMRTLNDLDKNLYFELRKTLSLAIFDYIFHLDGQLTDLNHEDVVYLKTQNLDPFISSLNRPLDEISLHPQLIVSKALSSAAGDYRMHDMCHMLPGDVETDLKYDNAKDAYRDHDGIQLYAMDFLGYRQLSAEGKQRNSTGPSEINIDGNIITVDPAVMSFLTDENRQQEHENIRELKLVMKGFDSVDPTCPGLNYVHWIDHETGLPINRDLEVFQTLKVSVGMDKKFNLAKPTAVLNEVNDQYGIVPEDNQFPKHMRIVPKSDETANYNKRWDQMSAAERARLPKPGVTFTEDRRGTSEIPEFSDPGVVRAGIDDAYHASNVALLSAIIKTPLAALVNTQGFTGLDLNQIKKRQIAHIYHLIDRCTVAAAVYLRRRDLIYRALEMYAGWNGGSNRTDDPWQCETEGMINRYVLKAIGTQLFRYVESFLIKAQNDVIASTTIQLSDSHREPVLVHHFKRLYDLRVEAREGAKKKMWLRKRMLLNYFGDCMAPAPRVLEGLPDNATPEECIQFQKKREQRELEDNHHRKIMRAKKFELIRSYERSLKFHNRLEIVRRRLSRYPADFRNQLVKNFISKAVVAQFRSGVGRDAGAEYSSPPIALNKPASQRMFIKYTQVAFEMDTLRIVKWESPLLKRSINVLGNDSNSNIHRYVSSCLWEKYQHVSTDIVKRNDFDANGNAILVTNDAAPNLESNNGEENYENEAERTQPPAPQYGYAFPDSSEEEYEAERYHQLNNRQINYSDDDDW